MADIYKAKNPAPLHPPKAHHSNKYSHARKARLDYVLKPEFEKYTPDSPYNFTAAFCYYPHNIRFVNKDPEEEVIMLLRRHFITNVPWIAMGILLLFAPAFMTTFPFFEKLPMGYQVIMIIIWYLISTAYVLEKFLSWYFHVNIITDERIIEVDFHNLIYRELTDANISNIEDVTVMIGGGIRTFLNYGDVQIQTAGEVPQLQFEAVPKPDIVSKVLRELRIEEEQEKIEGRVR